MLAIYMQVTLGNAAKLSGQVLALGSVLMAVVVIMLVVVEQLMSRMNVLALAKSAMMSVRFADQLPIQIDQPENNQSCAGQSWKPSLK